MSDEEKIVRNIISDIEKDMNSEENADYFKAWDINHKVFLISSVIATPLLFIVVAIECGFLGRIALAVYTISKLASVLGKRHEARIAKRMNEKMEKYTERLKDAGIKSEFMGTYFNDN